MKLNLGCGNKKLAGYLNVDLYGNPDMRVDLRAFPWPWVNESVDEIYSRGLFEHLPEFMRSLRGCRRILQPQGKITMIVPHYDSPLECWPEQHLHRFSLHTFNILLQFDDEYMGGKHLFDNVSVQLFYGPRMKFLTPIANVFPRAWEWLHLPTAEIKWVGMRI